MKNLVLITSIIKPPIKPLSYTKIRSVFSPEMRFKQTQNTINSIKQKIPNSQIFIVECSKLSEEEENYFRNNCDYFLNLINDATATNYIYSHSKSLGEGTMTILAINFIKQNNIEYDAFFKISGRYWLSNNFNYNNFENANIIVKYINNDVNNCCTSLYKLCKNNIDDFLYFLISKNESMINCIGYEVLFAIFLKSNSLHNITNLNKIGVNGFISVSNDFIDD